MLHPDFSYVLFTDEDILAFIRERTPSWLPLYKGLTHHAIQRVDLFRYLAIYYYGGLYLEARPCRAAACEPRTHRVLSLGIVVQHVVVGRACVAEGRR